MTVELTSDEILSNAAMTLGMTKENATRVAARCIIVRELARAHRTEFVLKGGALLFHVYGSPRSSVLDTDFATPKGSDVNVPEAADALTIAIDGFSMDAKSGRWSGDKDMLTGTDLPFSLSGVNVKELEKQLNVSFSVRSAEVIDGVATRPFNASLFLAEDNVFDVSCLSLEELAAEKVLATIFKGDLLLKHPFDVAVLGRDHFDLGFKKERFLEVLAEKMRNERAGVLRGNYDAFGIKKVADVPGAFLPDEVREDIRSQWDAAWNTSIILTIEEQSRQDHLSEVDRVFAVIDDTFVPLLEQLK